MRMPKISVVLPVLKTSLRLCEALDSVTRQTLKDIQIICVSGSQADSSLAIIKEYASEDNRIVVIDKPNGGYGHYLNAGMDAATGEYLGVLETDDFLALTMYEDLYSLAEQHRLDTIRGSYYRYNRNENGDTYLQYVAIDGNQGWMDRVYEPDSDLSCMRVQPYNWAGIYHLPFLREYHIRFNEMPGVSFMDDGFFWQVQIHARRAMLLNKPYYYRHWDKRNAPVIDTDDIWATTREYDFIRGILMLNPAAWEKYHEYYWCLRFYSNDVAESVIPPESKAEFITALSAEYRDAQASQEMSRALFTNNQWSKIQFITRCPEDYIQINAVNRKALVDAKKEKEAVRAQLDLALNAERWCVYLLRGFKKIVNYIKVLS